MTAATRWLNASFGGSCLVRITPEGDVDRLVKLPVTNPTRCTFGGPDRKTLVVTSAQFTVSDQQLAENPTERAVLMASMPVAGVPHHQFGA
jgi:sugar lactone lactonase YvrE